ncbi:MAG: hypothetical protein EPO20_08815 [Betaproteobacteria bacterium]|nr:MAG: hypothetical protein EPO20_08815 [Betaproteobacteria bacterium]
MKVERVAYQAYPCIDFLLKQRGWLLPLIALLPLIGTIVAFSNGMTFWVLAAGAAASAVMYLLLRAFIELLQVLADFILPR